MKNQVRHSRIGKNLIPVGVITLALMMGIFLQGCGVKKNGTAGTQQSGGADNAASQTPITEEMAYEGVNNYCHSVYDWSIAEEDPSIMYVRSGEETDMEYQVIFRSYTGAFVYFYVDKASGVTRIVEYVPTLDVEEEAGEINLFNYLK